MIPLARPFTKEAHGGFYSLDEVRPLEKILILCQMVTVDHEGRGVLPETVGRGIGGIAAGASWLEGCNRQKVGNEGRFPTSFFPLKTTEHLR